MRGMRVRRVWRLVGDGDKGKSNMKSTMKASEAQAPHGRPGRN